MTDQRTSPETAAGSAVTPAVPAASSRSPGPTIYPFEVAQNLVDQTAYFPMYAVPERKRSCVINHGNQRSGIQGTHILHRFQMYLNLPSRRAGVKAVNIA